MNPKKKLTCKKFTILQKDLNVDSKGHSTVREAGALSTGTEEAMIASVQVAFVLGKETGKIIKIIQNVILKDVMTLSSLNVNTKDVMTPSSPNVNIKDAMTRNSQNVNIKDAMTQNSQNVNIKDAMTRLFQNVTIKNVMIENIQNVTLISRTNLSERNLTENGIMKEKAQEEVILRIPKIVAVMDQGADSAKSHLANLLAKEKVNQKGMTVGINSSYEPI